MTSFDSTTNSNTNKESNMKNETHPNIGRDINVHLMLDTPKEDKGMSITFIDEIGPEGKGNVVYIWHNEMEGSKDDFFLDDVLNPQFPGINEPLSLYREGYSVYFEYQITGFYGTIDDPTYGPVINIVFNYEGANTWELTVSRLTNGKFTNARDSIISCLTQDLPSMIATIKKGN